MKKEFVSQTKMLLNLNNFTQKDRLTLGYHMMHIKFAQKYALLLNRKLGNPIDPMKMSFVALVHDILKEHGLHKIRDGKVSWNDHNIPQDLNRYVRMNLNILDQFNLGDYFNTDVQLHALAAGIFLYKELDIDDPEILYPVFFHSCPIMDVYKDLPQNIKDAVDIMMLADKLSSNNLRINVRNHMVRVDLDKSVFGESGREFNYTLGLYIARLISQGKSPDKQSILTTEYYYNKLCETNPLITKNVTIKSLGGNRLWQKRKSQAWKKQ